MDASKHEHTINIETTPDRLWQSITDPDQTRRYWYGALNRSAWTPGAKWTSESDTGELFLDGQILEVDAPLRLVQTFHVVHEPDAAAESPSLMTWEITPVGDSCELRVTHEHLGPATRAYVQGGWEFILQGLKAMLETKGSSSDSSQMSMAAHTRT